MLFVKTDEQGFIKEYYFGKELRPGFIETKEYEANQKTPYSKLENGVFVLNEEKYNAYLLAVEKENQRQNAK